jgi:hypothetical protein
MTFTASVRNILDTPSVLVAGEMRRLAINVKDWKKLEEVHF